MQNCGELFLSKLGGEVELDVFEMPKPKPVVRWMKLAPMLSRNMERTMLLKS